MPKSLTNRPNVGSGSNDSNMIENARNFSKENSNDKNYSLDINSKADDDRNKWNKNDTNRGISTEKPIRQKKEGDGKIRLKSVTDLVDNMISKK